MKDVTIVQYMRPDGRKQIIGSQVEDDVADKVERLQADGFEISMEVLTTGQIAMYVSDSEQDRAIKITENGPGIRSVFEKMIREFEDGLATDQNN